MGDKGIDLQHKLYVSCSNIHNNNYSNNYDIGENTFKDHSRLFFLAEWISYYKNNHEGNLFHIWSKKMLSKTRPLIQLFKAFQKEFKDETLIRPLSLYSSSLVVLGEDKLPEVLDYLKINNLQDSVQEENIIENNKVIGKKVTTITITDESNYNIQTIFLKDRQCYTRKIITDYTSYGDRLTDTNGDIIPPEETYITPVTEGALVSTPVEYKNYSRGYRFTETITLDEDFKNIIASYVSQSTGIQNKDKLVYSMFNDSLNGYSETSLPECVLDSLEYESINGKAIIVKSCSLSDMIHARAERQINDEIVLHYNRYTSYDDNGNHTTSTEYSRYTITGKQNTLIINPECKFFVRLLSETEFKDTTYNLLDYLPIENSMEQFTDFISNKYMFTTGIDIPSIFNTSVAEYLSPVDEYRDGIYQKTSSYSDKNPKYFLFNKILKETITEVTTMYEINEETIVQIENNYQKTFLHYIDSTTYNKKHLAEYPDGYVNMLQVCDTTKDIESIQNILSGCIYRQESTSTLKDVFYPIINLVTPLEITGNGQSVICARTISYPAQYTKPAYGNTAFSSDNTSLNYQTIIHNPFNIVEKELFTTMSISYFETIPTLYVKRGKIILFVRLLFQYSNIGFHTDSITISSPKQFISSRVKLVRLLPDDIEIEDTDTITVEVNDNMYNSKYSRYKLLVCEIDTEIDDTIETIYDTERKNISYKLYKITASTDDDTGKPVYETNYCVVNINVSNVSGIMSKYEDKIEKYSTLSVKTYYGVTDTYTPESFTNRIREDKLLNIYMNKLGFNLDSFVLKYASGNKFVTDKSLNATQILSDITYGGKTYKSSAEIIPADFAFKEYLNYSSYATFVDDKGNIITETVTDINKEQDDYQSVNNWAGGTWGRLMETDKSLSTPVVPANAILLGINLYMFKNTTATEGTPSYTLKLSWMTDGEKYYLFHFLKYLLSTKIGTEPTNNAEANNFDLRFQVDTPATAINIAVVHRLSINRIKYIHSTNTYSRIKEGITILDKKGHIGCYTPSTEAYKLVKINEYTLQIVEVATNNIIEAEFNLIDTGIFCPFRMILKEKDEKVDDDILYAISYYNEASTLSPEVYSKGILFPLSYEILSKTPVMYQLQIYYNSIKFYDYKLSLATSTQPSTLEQIGMAIVGIVMAIVGIVISVVSLGSATPVGAALIYTGIGVSVAAIVTSVVAIILYVTGSIDLETFNKIQTVSGIIGSIGGGFAAISSAIGAGTMEIVNAAINVTGVVSTIAITAANEAIENQFEDKMKKLEKQFKEFNDKIQGKLDVIEQIKDELNSKSAMTLDSPSTLALLGIKRVSNNTYETPTQFFNRTKNIDSKLNSYLNFPFTSVEKFVKMTLSLY